MNSEQSFNNSTGPNRPLEEKQWVRRIREDDDRLAFKKVFHAYYKRLHGFAHSYVKNMQEAEDIVQTVFLRIWSQRESWDPPGTVKNYLFSAVRNEALNVLRHQQIVDDAEEEVVRILRELNMQTYSDDDPEVGELRKDIQRAIDALPAKCKEIFMLNRRSGLTYSEITEVLNISINTVSTQMGRALKHLREHLSDYLYLYAATELSTILSQAIFFLLLIFSFMIV